MIKNQLGRRNLTPTQKIGRYAEKMIELETIVAKERMLAGVEIEDSDPTLNLGEGKKGEVSEIVGDLSYERTTLREGCGH
jgi:hypothetical protein